VSEDHARLSIHTESQLFGRGAPVQFGTGFALPAEFTATIEDHRLPFDVVLNVRVEDGEPHITAMTLNRRESGPPIAARDLRLVPLRRFLDASVEAVLMRVEQTRPGHYRISPAGEDDRVRRQERAENKAGTPRRRTDAVTIEREARQAMQLWGEARERDDEWRKRPTEFVAHRLNVSRATAARRLKWARAHPEGEEEP
jgi:hypothetical protein